MCCVIWARHILQRMASTYIHELFHGPWYCPQLCCTLINNVEHSDGDDGGDSGDTFIWTKGWQASKGRVKGKLESPELPKSWLTNWKRRTNSSIHFPDIVGCCPLWASHPGQLLRWPDWVPPCVHSLWDPAVAASVQQPPSWGGGSVRRAHCQGPAHTGPYRPPGPNQATWRTSDL